MDTVCNDVERLILSFVEKERAPILRLVCRKWNNLLRFEACYIRKKKENALAICLIRNGELSLLKWFETMHKPVHRYDVDIRSAALESHSWPMIDYICEKHRKLDQRPITLFHDTSYIDHRNLWEKLDYIECVAYALDTRNYAIIRDERILEGVVCEARRYIHYSPGTLVKCILTMFAHGENNLALRVFQQTGLGDYSWPELDYKLFWRIMTKCEKLEHLRTAMEWLEELSQAAYVRMIAYIFELSYERNHEPYHFLEMFMGTGCVPILEFILSFMRGCDEPTHRYEVLQPAVKGRHKELICWYTRKYLLRDHSYMLLVYAMDNLDMHMVQWLLSDECRELIGAYEIPELISYCDSDIPDDMMHYLLQRMPWNVERSLPNYYLNMCDSPVLYDHWRRKVVGISEKTKFYKISRHAIRNCLPRTLEWVFRVHPEVDNRRIRETYILNITMHHVEICNVHCTMDMLITRVVLMLETLREHRGFALSIKGSLIGGPRVYHGSRNKDNPYPYARRLKDEMPNLFRYILDHAPDTENVSIFNKHTDT
jgi:hypothetical protein